MRHKILNLPPLSVTSCLRRGAKGDLLEGLGDMRLTGDPEVGILGVMTLDGDLDLDVVSEVGEALDLAAAGDVEASGLNLTGDGEAERWSTVLTGE